MIKVELGKNFKLHKNVYFLLLVRGTTHFVHCFRSDHRPDNRTENNFIL